MDGGLRKPNKDSGIWNQEKTKAFQTKSYYEIPNTIYNRKLAANCLISIFDGLEPNDISEIIKNVVAPTSTLETSESFCDSERKYFQDKLEKVSNNGIEYLYDLWAEILIFAVTLKTSTQEDSIANVFIASKGEIEKLYPLNLRTFGAKRQVLVNYASTSFIANKEISNEYPEEWVKWLNTDSSSTKIDIVLTCPGTPAETDAIDFKMKPRFLKCSPGDIITKNIDELHLRIEKDKVVGTVRLFLTNVCLPCGYFMNEFADSSMDNIKVDLYLPNFSGYVQSDETLSPSQMIPEDLGSDTEIRQSFVVMNKGNQKELYTALKTNIEAILANSKPLDISKGQKIKKIREEIKEMKNNFTCSSYRTI